MIVCSTQPVYRYSGLSTDTKPTTNVRDASTFWETDTGRRFEWRGTTWCEDTPAPVTIDIPALETIHVSNFPATQPVSIATMPTTPVTGTFYQDVQPVSQPMAIPKHDTRITDESAAPATTIVTYKLAGVTVATKTITISGTSTTIAVVLA